MVNGQIELAWCRFLGIGINFVFFKWKSVYSKLLL